MTTNSPKFIEALIATINVLANGNMSLEKLKVRRVNTPHDDHFCIEFNPLESDDKAVMTLIKEPLFYNATIFYDGVPQNMAICSPTDDLHEVRLLWDYLDTQLSIAEAK
jgi:hypothetical protein